MKIAKKKTEIGGSPPWMTSYADLVTLLLTFFILLFTFSSIDVQRFQEVMSAIQHNFMGRTGIMPGSSNLSGEEGARLEPFEVYIQELVITLGEEEAALLELRAEMEETYNQVTSFLIDIGLQDEAQVSMEDRGVVLELPERILFDSGEAMIKREFVPFLEMLATLIEGLPNQIIIEGHTDNIPINTYRYPSNWELSVARSVSVARFLVEGCDLPPQKFVVTGYGEFHPLDSNETPEGRSRNRRVSIVISIIKL
jgi:chemotaxis protein MotB